MRTLVLAIGISMTLAACDGHDPAPPSPRLVPGGGIGDGPINGLMNVYVTDEESDAPVAGAAVRVGTSAAPSPCLGTTDSTGLVVFDRRSCPSLQGPQTVTASASGHAPATWIGVGGANITMTLRRTGTPALETAEISGTIEGWDSLPAPAANHNTLGIVGYSHTRTLGDRANEIAQGMRTVLVAGIIPVPVPANVCVRTREVSDCAWRLTTRVGRQAHYAVIVDQDTKGTASDADDTYSVTGWAIKTGLTFAAGEMVGGEALARIPDSGMITMAVAFGSAPSGLDDVVALPIVDLGAEGRLIVAAPRLDTTSTSARVPALTGALGSATYDVIGRAQDAANVDQPSTLTWLHGVNPGGTVMLGSWLPPPAAITAAAGRYSFEAVAGATLHGAELKAASADETLWSVSIFDGSTTFTLPGLVPDPLPAGMVRLVTNAIEIPGINLRDVAFDQAREKLTRLSSDALTFTR
jgi:hypothetical protein